MALSASTVFEVRSTGTATAGGGFVTGSSGTDWSLQDSPQYSVTDGVTAGTATIVSATAAFGTDVVGNIIYVQGGTGSITAGWYQIVSRTNSTAIVVDRSTGLTSGIGVTLHIGGAFSTIAAALAVMTVERMTTYVKATATYSISTGLSFASGPSFSGITRLIGYTTTRGDGGKPTIQATAGSITMLTIGVSGCQASNFIIDGNSQTSILGVDITAQYTPGVIDCKIMNCTNSGLRVSLQNSAERIEVTGCSTQPAVIASNAGAIFDCWVHDNTVTGISLAGGAGTIVSGCIVSNNTGASSDGILLELSNLVVGCSIHGNGRDGIREPNAYYGMQFQICDNIITGNGGYGINFASGTADLSAYINYNAYGASGAANTSGAYHNITAGTNDISLTGGNPYTSSASNDFSLNSTANAGAACKQVAHARPGGAISYHDIGALGAQSSGGGGNPRLVNGGLIAA